MFKNILMPTDGSKHSERAIERGVELAKLCGAKVTGLHALPNYRMMMASFEDVAIDPGTEEEIEKDAAARATRFLGFVQKTAAAAGVPCETVIATDDLPYDSIINTANEHGCDLIVITARYHLGLASLVMGSKADRVLHRASIPVLTFRALKSADHPDKTLPRWQDLFHKKTKNNGNSARRFDDTV